MHQVSFAARSVHINIYCMISMEENNNIWGLGENFGNIVQLWCDPQGTWLDMWEHSFHFHRFLLSINSVNNFDLRVLSLICFNSECFSQVSPKKSVWMTHMLNLQKKAKFDTCEIGNRMNRKQKEYYPRGLRFVTVKLENLKPNLIFSWKRWSSIIKKQITIEQFSIS